MYSLNNVFNIILLLLLNFIICIKCEININENGTSSAIKADRFKKCADGLIVPAWNPQDNLTTWDRTFRGAVYFFALLYLFLGVSIISDR
ncbi:hypothetical protein O3M35_004092 [Rhynocoris fuscipes]|uniref:Uncharacterized protein n=1 Tax=Rhynocoris fuscipes TaxID=488301 RepID=A0AAW1CIJ9_9HEMI